MKGVVNINLIQYDNYFNGEIYRAAGNIEEGAERSQGNFPRREKNSVDSKSSSGNLPYR